MAPAGQTTRVTDSAHYPQHCLLFFNIVQLAVTIPNVSGSDHHRHVMHASASVSNLCLVVEQSAQLRANTASSTLLSRAACQPQYRACFCACRWDPQDRCAYLAITNVLLLNCICFLTAEVFLRLQVLLCSFVVSGSMPWSGSS